ncbi:unnamed protein product [Ectocarpus sp. CCAP 1310/34]|nr:unnamed protein product [Ectocarpus sp. CCAP 1310/34]
MRLVFGMSESCICEAFNWMLHFLELRWEYLLPLDVERLQPHLIEFAEAIYMIPTCVPLLICPFKVYANVAEQQWSKRLESVRKDIECLFGRLKGRFRLFKTGILFGDRTKIDDACFTACIIHNMLLAFDGLDQLEIETAGAFGLRFGKEQELAKRCRTRMHAVGGGGERRERFENN